jgi:hypothetical protein
LIEDFGFTPGDADAADAPMLHFQDFRCCFRPFQLSLRHAFSFLPPVFRFRYFHASTLMLIFIFFTPPPPDAIEPPPRFRCRRRFGCPFSSMS